MAQQMRAPREAWWRVDVAPDAVLGVGDDGRVMFANVQAHTLFGWEPTALVGQPVEALLPEGQRARYLVHHRDVTATPPTRPMGSGFELEARRRDGTTFPAEISLSTVEGDDGEAVVIATVRDITEQRRAQARFRTLLEEAPDAIVGLDGAGTVVLINAQAEALFRTSLALARGLPFAALLDGQVTNDRGDTVALVPDEDRTTFEWGVEEVLDGRLDALTLRYRVEMPGRGPAVLEARVRAVADDLGSDGMLIISRDVSEHVHLEEALRAAKDDADEANDAKSRFLSRVSHELRTPLNAILGFGQLLALKDLEPDDHEYVRQILSGGRHLLGLVNEVLEIARTEGHELEAVSGPVALGPLVREVLELMAPLASASGVELDARSSAACDAWVTADLDRLRQVLLNLVSNGVKYNHPGGHVAVTATPSVTGSTVRISVIDDGWGIAEEDQVRLFQPFERLGATHSSVEGTGIGLALSQGLVDAMEGTIGMTSSEEQGCTFWVELPASAPEPDATGSPPPATVLLVERDPASAFLTERLLHHLPGITVEVAGSGAEGLDRVARVRPDLVLLDVDLPDMAGEDFLGQLRRHELTEKIPAVVLSADADPHRLSALRSAGAQGTMTRPIEVPGFLRLVSDVLNRRPR